MCLINPDQLVTKHVCCLLSVGKKHLFLLDVCSFLTLTPDCARRPRPHQSFSFLLKPSQGNERPYSDFDISIQL